MELPAKASVHINMQQDFTQRASELQSLRDQAYGGFFIRAESPTARILVNSPRKPHDQNPRQGAQRMAPVHPA